MTTFTQISPKSATRAAGLSRFSIPILTMFLAIGGIMFGTMQADAGQKQYRHHKNSGNFSVQFNFGNGAVSTRKVVRPHIYREQNRHYRPIRQRVPVAHTCSPHRAAYIAKKHYKMHHARVTQIAYNHILVEGRKHGKRVHLAVGHYCQVLR